MVFSTWNPGGLEPPQKKEPERQPEAGVLPPSKPKFSMIKIVFGSLVLLSLAAAAGYAYSIYSGSKNLDLILEFSVPDDIFIGQPFEAKFSASNAADKIITNPKLVLVLPQGLSLVGKPADQRVEEEDLADMAPGDIFQRTIRLIASENGEGVKKLETRLEYSTPATLTARFAISKSANLALREPAMSLVINAPQKVVSGELFETEIKYQNISKEEIKNAALTLAYPQNFELADSTLQPDKGNNYWKVNNLQPGEEGSFKIRGRARGAANLFFNITGTLSAEVGGQSYNFNKRGADISITASPLSLDISLQQGNSYVARLGDKLKYILTYRNNADFAFQNANISVNLSGEMFDFSSINTNGSFNSLTNTITWLAANTPALANIPTGAEQTVTFEVKLKNSYPIRRLSDKNFALKARGQIESPTVAPGAAVEKTLTVAELQNKVGGLIKIDARAYFSEPTADIKNSGPFPPLVNQPTQYTVHWLITNYATDIGNIEISSFLQGNTRFTGQAKSNLDVLPEHNPATGEVSWLIKNLPATKGIVSQPAEAIFQIEVTPAITDLNSSIIFLGQTKIKAYDSFTGLELAAEDMPLSTDLQDDKTLGGDRRVRN